MTIVIYASSDVNKLRALLNDDARVVIYDCHMFIVQATGVFSNHSDSTKIFYIACFTMGLYHTLEGDTNLKYKLLAFLTTNKKIKEKGTSF